MTSDREPHLTRRQWLTSAAVIGGTAVAGGSLGGILHHSQGATTASSTSDEPTDDVFFGHVREPFYGPHQAGITSAIQAHASYLGFTFHPHATATDVVRTLRILTHDAALLTQGKGALADTEPELAHTPARLTVTVGFGPEFFDRAGIPHLRPPHLAQLPSYRIDRLDPAYGQTDLLLLIQGDDPTSVAHAARVHTRQIRSFAQRAWTQHGFSYARGTHPQGTTMRNLMGQVDGTHTAHTQASDEHVWLRDSDGDRHVGATTFVLRRIAMTLDTWDEVDRPGREDALGRRMSDGAPLTGTAEHDPPDFEARNDLGFPVIAPTRTSAEPIILIPQCASTGVPTTSMIHPPQTTPTRQGYFLDPFNAPSPTNTFPSKTGSQNSMPSTNGPYRWVQPCTTSPQESVKDNSWANNC